MSLISKTSIGLALFIALIPGYSFAQVLDCERLRLESRGFVSVSAAESWMPERLSISIDGDKAFIRKKLDDGTSKFVFRSGEVIQNKENGRVSIEFSQLTTGGRFSIIFHKFIGSKATLGANSKAGFGDLTPSVYNCAFVPDHNMSTTRQDITTLTEEKLCERATWSGAWDKRKFFKKYVNEA